MLDGALPDICTPRLRLRRPRADDAPALFAVFGDEEVVRYWSSPAMRDLEEARTLIREVEAHFDAQDLFQWVITQEDDGVIGTCTLYALDANNRRAEIGFALGRDFWGQGYALEATTALVEFAFGKLNLARLEADVDPRNGPSLALLRKLGFVREGYMPERYRVNDGVQDTVWLGLLASRWRSRDRVGPPGIRLMQLADRPRVVELLAAQMKEHQIPLERSMIEQAVDGLVARPELGGILVADEEDEVVGVAYVSFTWTLEHGGRVCWLEELYVAPLFRGRGLGTRLLEGALAHARAEGALAMDLEVEAGHERAARLYSRQGFRSLARTRWQKHL